MAALQLYLYTIYYIYYILYTSCRAATRADHCEVQSEDAGGERNNFRCMLASMTPCARTVASFLNFNVYDLSSHGSRCFLSFLLSFLWQACAKCTEDRHMDCLSRMCTASVRSIGDTSSPNITNYSRCCSKLRQEKRPSGRNEENPNIVTGSLLIEITTAEVMAVRNVSDANF